MPGYASVTFGKVEKGEGAYVAKVNRLANYVGPPAIIECRRDATKIGGRYAASTDSSDSMHGLRRFVGMVHCNIFLLGQIPDRKSNV